MAFESINVYSLRSSLNDCKNRLNHRAIDGLINDLNNNDWISDSKKNLKGALERLVNNRYSNLISKIDQYLNVTNMIEEYKNLEQDNIQKDNEISKLKPRQFTGGWQTTYYFDSNGEQKENIQWVDSEDKNITRQIDDLKNQINYNTSKMESLKTRIYNSI